LGGAHKGEGNAVGETMMVGAEAKKSGGGADGECWVETDTKIANGKTGRWVKTTEKVLDIRKLRVIVAGCRGGGRALMHRKKKGGGLGKGQNTSKITTS